MLTRAISATLATALFCLLLPRPSCAQTHYWALLIGNNDGDDFPDVLENGLLNFATWNPGNNAKNRIGRIKKLKNLEGVDIIKEIKKWVADINAFGGPNDVVLFMYGGHGGTVADVDADETPGTDPGCIIVDPFFGSRVIDDNDNERLVDGVIGLSGLFHNWKKNCRTDDDVMVALSALPATCTKIVIVDSCHAFEHALGTRDSDSLGEIAVMASSAEGCTQRVFEGYNWIARLSDALFDLAPKDGFADADADHDGKVSVAEWAAAAGVNPFYSVHMTNPNRNVLNGFLNWGRVPLHHRSLSNGDMGFEGTGVCSPPDFGDAPDDGMPCEGPSGVQPRNYRTTLKNDGPRYDEWSLQWLGPIVDGWSLTDAEEDGQPACGADGDGADDEDGVEFGSNYVVVTVSVDYPAPTNYRLDAWWDLDDNGTFDPGEHVIDGLVDYDGTHGGKLIGLAGHPASFPVTYLLGFDPRAYFSRFRLTFGVDEEITPSGAFLARDGAAHGEVEDYAPRPVGGAFGRLDDGAIEGGFVVQLPSGSSDYFNNNFGSGAGQNGVIALSIAVLDLGTAVPEFPSAGISNANLGVDPTGNTPDVAGPGVLATISPFTFTAGTFATTSGLYVSHAVAVAGGLLGANVHGWLQFPPGDAGLLQLGIDETNPAGRSLFSIDGYSSPATKLTTGNGGIRLSTN